MDGIKEIQRTILVTYMLELRARSDLSGRERMALWQAMRARLDLYPPTENTYAGEAQNDGNKRDLHTRMRTCCPSTSNSRKRETAVHMA